MFRQYPKYKFILALGDFVLLIASLGAAISMGCYGKPITDLLAQPFNATDGVVILAYGSAFIVIFQHFALYKINVFLTGLDQIIAIVKAIGCGVAGMIIASLVVTAVDWAGSPAMFGYFVGFSLAAITVFRTVLFQRLFAMAAQKKLFRRKVLIVGSDEAAKRVSVELDVDESHGFEVVGFASDEFPEGATVFRGFQNLGKTAGLHTLVARHEIDDVIIAQSDISHHALLELIDRAKETRANVRLTSQLYRIIPEKVLLEKYLGRPIVLMPQNYNSLVFGAYKRAFDVVAASVALVLLAVPFLGIAALIKCSSRGPVFFRDTRIGKDGKPFRFYKFRTMYTNCDDAIHRQFVSKFIQQSGAGETGGVKKLTDDPRVTKIGRFLRRTSIDELPQLFNVLLGAMSLVGPRPCLPYEWEQFEDWHRRRSAVIPGCTGLWQVSGRSAVAFNDMVILDLFYIDNMSPLLDLKIMFRTIPVMLLAKGGH
jgi:exopolysaccharide biosynthesis polyprenyl glycosylphosphotransferase